MKQYILYAGVNGAGKSTLYGINDYKHITNRVNMDEITAQIGSWKNVKDSLLAGKIAVKKIQEYIDNRESFIQESTLCGQSIIKNLEKVKKVGYEIDMRYVGVNSVEIAKERVKYRVSTGGHGIPEADIERRYEASFKNLCKAFSLCDEIQFYDNTNNMYNFAKLNKKLLIYKEVKPKWFIEKIEPDLITYCHKMGIEIINNDKIML